MMNGSGALRIALMVADIREEYEEVCWLPHHLLLGTEEDLDDIVRVIEKIYQHRRELMS